MSDADLPRTTRDAPTATPRRGIRLPHVLLAGYLVVLALIAFWPYPVDRDAGDLLQAISRLVPVLTYPRIEFLANIALFVPLGWLLALILPRARSLVVPIGVVATVAIESLQAVMLSQRTPSVLDIIANTTGACVGLLLAVAIESARARRTAHARR